MRKNQDAMKLVTMASVAGAALLLQACASTSFDKSAVKSGASAHANAQSDASGLDPIAAAAFWGTRYDREPTNAEVAVKFSSALRKMGSFDESMKVMSRISSLAPDNANVMLEYGKSLIEGNRAFEAVRPIEFALSKHPDDWRILSAYGVALDQIGEHKTARQQYDRALAINPAAISVLNNKGLSYALSGDIDLARNTLVLATGNRAADAKVRQNLALVMALKGDIRSAERLARSDLPPQVADNNVEYFRTLLSQPAYWQDFAARNVDTPNFDTPSGNDAPSFDEVPEFESEPSVPSVSVAPSIAPEPLPPVEDEPENASTPVPLPPIVEEEEEIDPNEGVPLVLGPVTRPSTASFVETPVVEDVEVSDQALEAEDQDANKEIPSDSEDDQ